MPYILDDTFLTVGYELEIAGGGSYATWRRILNDAGFDWLKVVPDGTPVVDCEIVTPPMPMGLYGGADYDLGELFAFIERNGGTVSRRDLGGHIHVGNRAIKGMTTADYWRQSKQLMRDRGEFFVPADDNCCDVMPLVLVKDVAVRYAEHQDAVNSILPQSRRYNRYCNSISHIAPNGRQHDAFMTAQSASNMASILGGKFVAVNMQTWSRGTVEFRQHQATLSVDKLKAWSLLIDAMFRHSDRYRVDYNANTPTTVDTPASPYRNGSRIAVMWSLMRRDNGATTRDLMNATGWTAQTIRARVSEMRRDHGEQTVICNNQQAYGHSYGASNGEHDLNGYIIPQSITIQRRDNGGLLPENQRGVSSIWAGLDDQLFEYFNTRRDQLS